MAKVIKRGKLISELSHFKLSRFFPEWKPGDVLGHEDYDFPSKRRPLRPEEIEQEIKQRIAQEEPKWHEMVVEAHSKGVQEGITKGHAMGREEIEPAVTLLREWVGVLDAQKTEFFRNLEESLLKLGVFITEKIIAREIRQDVKIVQEMVSRALAKVSHGGKITVKVHPDDLQRVQSMSLGELLPQGTGGDIVLEGDHKVDPGGCIIETPGGVIDSRISTQLEEIFREVFGEVPAVSHNVQENASGESAELTSFETTDTQEAHGVS